MIYDSPFNDYYFRYSQTRWRESATYISTVYNFANLQNKERWSTFCKQTYGKNTICILFVAKLPEYIQSGNKNNILNTLKGKRKNRKKEFYDSKYMIYVEKRR